MSIPTENTAPTLSCVVPDEAVRAAIWAHRSNRLNPNDRIEAAVEAAAPLIVAAELRIQAAALCANADITGVNAMTGQMRSVYYGVAEALLNRAVELDGSVSA